VLLRATLSAWRHQRAFQAGPAAAEFDRLMERLEAGTEKTHLPAKPRLSRDRGPHGR
jgi:hypothetical protein